MLARRQLRLAVIGALNAAKAANSFAWTIYSPGDWPTDAASLASGAVEFLVRCGDEAKAPVDPGALMGIPKFNTDCTIEIEARLVGNDAPTAQDSIEALGYTVENLLLTDYSLGLAVQQFASVHTKTEVTAEGAPHIAGFFMQLGMQVYEEFDPSAVAPPAATWPLVPNPIGPLKTIGISMDLGNVFDPRGTYQGAEFDEATPAPRRFGPDGRIEELLLIQNLDFVGPGSMLHLMASDYFDGDPFGEVHLLPLADASGATAAVGSVLFTAAATAAGTFSLYIGGVRVQQPVLTTQTAANLATALAALVNATPNLPVSAAVNGSNTAQVDLTALNAGVAGNEIDIRANYGGAAVGEATPAGMGVSITTRATAGAANTGNGTISTPTLSIAAARGVYAIIFTSATAFSVTDPNGNAVGTGTTGTAFNTGGLKFTITVGGTAFVASDSFSIDMPASNGGALTPSLTAPLANLGDKAYDFIVLPYTDSTSLNAMQAFLADSAGRWSYLEQVYGHAFATYRGTYGALTTFGPTRNDQHATIMGVYDTPTPAWRWAAQMVAAAAVSLRNYAAQPLQTLAITDALAPPLSSRFPLAERNSLLFAGISTFTVGDDGTVAIERLITTYQVNPYGQPDNSYLPVERMYQLMFVLRALKTGVTSTFGRCALADDGTRFAPGLPIVTPSIIRAWIIAKYRELEFQGYVQDSDAFAAGLIVQRNAQDRTRVDVLWDGILTDQLNIFALLAMFTY